MSTKNEFMVIPEDREKKRKLEWWTNKFTFIPELEKFLSYCPNMTGEDDLRDLCEGKCPCYGYCISVEPSTEGTYIHDQLDEICKECVRSDEYAE